MTEDEFIKEYFKNYSNKSSFYNEAISAADILAAVSKHPLGAEAIKIGGAALDNPLISKLGVGYFLPKKLADLVIGGGEGGDSWLSKMLDSTTKTSAKDKISTTEKKSLLDKMRFNNSPSAFQRQPSLFLKYIIIGYILKGSYEDINQQKSKEILDDILSGNLAPISPKDSIYPKMESFNNSTLISINGSAINAQNFYDCMKEHLSSKRDNVLESINLNFKITDSQLNTKIIEKIFSYLYSKNDFVYQIKGN